MCTGMVLNILYGIMCTGMLLNVLDRTTSHSASNYLSAGHTHTQVLPSFLKTHAGGGG